MQVGDALVGVDHRQRRAVGELGVEGGLDLGALRQRGEPGEDAAEAVVRGRGRPRQRRRRAAAKVVGKKAWTTWPKMIGSETFIIVAFRCTENSTPSALARAICSARNVRSAATPHDGRVDDLVGEHRHGLAQHGGRAVGADQLDPQRSVRRRCTADFSLERKSSWPIVATLVFDSADQAPIGAGGSCAYSFTEAGARRSELPSRSTGFTAEPLTLS